jgi:hypothetical protein
MQAAYLTSIPRSISLTGDGQVRVIIWGGVIIWRCIIIWQDVIILVVFIFVMVITSDYII